MNYHFLINAFINNGLPEKDAWDAAFAYRNCDLKPEEETQQAYDNAAREEISCWES